MEHLSWLLLELFLQGQDLKICGEDGQLSNIVKLHTAHALLTYVFIGLRTGIRSLRSETQMNLKNRKKMKCRHKTERF